MRNFIHHEFGKLERITGIDGKRVYRTPTGVAYPSVTTVTGLHTAKQIAQWRQRVGNEEANRISARASSRGTAIHSLCESFLRGEDVSPNMFTAEMFASIKPLLNEIDNIHALEDPLFSDHLQVAGTVDCVAEFRNKISIIDFKTSSRIKSREDIGNYFMQCSAYAVAFEERTKIPVSRLVILMAVDNENPLVFVEKRDDWIDAFKKLRFDYKTKYGV
jgi:ATP-dependent exoDNAse (exonuclease V) beta subunit